MLYLNTKEIESLGTGKMHRLIWALVAHVLSNDGNWLNFHEQSLDQGK